MDSSKPTERPAAQGNPLLARWRQFRTESPYFQAKVGLTALYIAVVVLTVIVAPPAVAPWVCREERIDFGLSFKTAIEITNVSNGELDDIVVEVHGKAVEYNGAKVPGQWSSKPVSLPEGERVRLLAERLTDAQGVVAPGALETERVVLKHKGDKIAELVPERPAPAQ